MTSLAASPVTPDARLAALARAQAGVFTRGQALACGMSRTTVEHRLWRGVWLALYPRIYCAATTRLGPEARASAARLRAGEGAMFSHITGARLAGLEVPVDDRRLWLTTRWKSPARSWPGVNVVRTRHPPEPVQRHGQPVTPPARTFIDLATVLGREALVRSLHDAVRSKLVTPAEILSTAELLPRRPGLRVLRQVIAEYDPAFELHVEHEAHTALLAAGMHFTPQYELWDGWLLIARFDLADDEIKLALELDGPSHEPYAAQRHDRQRDRSVRRFGWTTVRYGLSEMRSMDAFVADVAAQREALLRERRLNA